MGLLSRMLEKRANDPTDDRYYGLGGVMTSAGIEINEANALTISAVYKCVKILSEAIGTLPLQMFERRGDANIKATDHPYYDLLHIQPNPETTAAQYRMAQVVHLATWGNHYSMKEVSQSGAVKALWPLSPARVTPTRNRSGKLVYEFRPNSGPTEILPSERVLHIAGFGFNGIMGFSPVGMMRESMGLAKAAEQYGAGFFKNDASPGGVLESPNVLSDGAFKRLKKDWADTHRGVKNVRNIAILEEGLKWSQTGLPPEDAQFIETQQYQARDIYGIYRISPHLAGDLERATFSNITELGIEFVVYTLQPILVSIEQALSTQLLTRKEREKYFFEHLTAALMRGDPEKRAALYTALRNIGVMSANEIRRKENMNPIPKEKGGDDYLIPLNMVVAGAPPIALAPPPTAKPDDQTEDEQRIGRLQTRRERTQRSIIGRNRVAQAYRQPIIDAADQVIRKETSAVRWATNKYLNAARSDAARSARSDDNPVEFMKYIDDFYQTTMPDYTRDRMRPVFHSFAEALQLETAQEIGATPGMSSGLEFFVDDYAAVYGARHIDSSRGQINKLVREAPAEELSAQIVERMGEWEERMPAKTGANETIQLAGAVAMFIYAANGLQWVWINQGSKSCPICEEMNGTVIGSGGAFVASGTILEADSSQGPVLIRGPKMHPPLHEGCICTIAAT